MNDEYVVIKQENIQITPLFCTICELLMRSRDDELAFQTFGCCDSCASFFAKPKRSLWESGWRPSKEEIVTMKSCLNPILVLLKVDDT